MNATGPGLVKYDPEKKSHVGLQLGLVSRETFWVIKSKGEVAEWFCLRKTAEPKHQHSKNPPCFTVKFEKGDACPFTIEQYASDENGYASSSGVKPSVKPDLNKTYKYTVTVGSWEEDPTGGVEP